MGKKYRIYIKESERSDCDRWVETYDTYSEALQRINAINGQNTLKRSPDWFMVAEGRIDVIHDGRPDEDSE
jgi:hypothetical protein